MTVPRAQFVAAVLAMVGTPFRHMGRLAGVGLDCVGVPLAALAACGAPLPEPEPYGNMPGGLEEALDAVAYRVPIDDRQPGDVLTFVIAGVARHVGVLVAMDEIVHAKGNIARVVRQPLHRSMAAANCWRLREVV